MRAPEPRAGLRMHLGGALDLERVDLDPDPLGLDRPHLVEDEGLAQLGEAGHDVGDPGAVIARQPRTGFGSHEPPGVFPRREWHGRRPRTGLGWTMRKHGQAGVFRPAATTPFSAPAGRGLTGINITEHE